jgi:hypothetical protein
MGTKRSHSEATHSGKQQGHGSRPGPHKHFSKRRKLDANEDSLSAIKKRARAIERLLAKGDLKSAPKKVELERELAAHKERIEAHKAKKHRSYMIGKYHMVRFFGTSAGLGDATAGGRDANLFFARKNGRRL